jgi:hypothetical protein
MLRVGVRPAQELRLSRRLYPKVASAQIIVISCARAHSRDRPSPPRVTGAESPTFTSSRLIARHTCRRHKPQLNGAKGVIIPWR